MNANELADDMESGMFNDTNYNKKKQPILYVSNKLK